MNSIEKAVGATTYPGRGIAIGKLENGNAFFAYFIMGRSVNSRNRVFIPEGDGIRTQAFDPSLMKDPSLIIYAPVRRIGDTLIVTNGDQTDTIYDALAEGKNYTEALRTRCFEPDPPNFTPRISLVAQLDGDMPFSMSILKSNDTEGKRSLRCFYEYDGLENGEGRFIHTYECDGNPIPSFKGEPEIVSVNGTLDSLTEAIWNGLNSDNRVSLWTAEVDLTEKKIISKIINRNMEA